MGFNRGRYDTRSDGRVVWFPHADRADDVLTALQDRLAAAEAQRDKLFAYFVRTSAEEREFGSRRYGDWSRLTDEQRAARRTERAEGVVAAMRARQHGVRGITIRNGNE